MRWRRRSPAAAGPRAGRAATGCGTKPRRGGRFAPCARSLLPARASAPNRSPACFSSRRCARRPPAEAGIQLGSGQSHRRLRSEIGAASADFPIAVAGRLRALRPAALPPRHLPRHANLSERCLQRRVCACNLAPDQSRLMTAAEPYGRTLTSPTPTARQVALDLIGAVLRRKRPLDDAIEDHSAITELSVRDRAFARLLVATVLRRLGQIDALIGECLNTPLAPRAALVHDVLRLGIAQLLFLRTPAHAAVATSVDLAHSRGFLSHKGLVNAVLRRLSVEGQGRVERQDAARLNTPEWLWRSWSRAYGEDVAHAIAAAHLKEAPLDLTVRAEDQAWCEKLGAMKLPTGSLRRSAGGSVTALPGYAEGAWWIQDAAAALPVRLFNGISGRQEIGRAHV